MNVISLFDGMGCIWIALKERGIKVNKCYSSEIDKFAIKQVKHNFPEVEHMGSVENWKKWDIDWKSIDLISAGSPCQGFSFAGKGLAFDDPRSRLFFVFAEILNHCRSLNPNVKFLLENVDMKKEYLRIISEYVGIFPVNIDSNLVSAQNRNRWYWSDIKVNEVGMFMERYTGITQPEDLGIYLKDILQPENEIDGKYYLTEKALEYLQRTPLNERFVQADTDPKAGCVTANYHKGIPYNVLCIDLKTASGTSSTRGGGIKVDKSQTLDHNCNLGIYLSEPRHKHGENRYYQDKAPTIQARYGTGGDNVPYVNNVRRLTPTECSRLQTIPEWYEWVVSDSQIYRMCGNGWTVKVIEHILSFLSCQE